MAQVDPMSFVLRDDNDSNQNRKGENTSETTSGAGDEAKNTSDANIFLAQDTRKPEKEKRMFRSKFPASIPVDQR